MTTRFNIQSKTQAALAVVALLALPLADAAPISKDDYTAGKTRISDTYKADKATCASFAANARDVCIEEGRAKEKVARAELEYSYSAKASDQTKVLVAKAESAYAVAKERCDDQAGNAKSVCVKEAKAVEVKAVADAKMVRKIGDAKTDAATDKRDADYQVAAQKCDALTGAAQTNCMNAAKARFGKV